jgi:ubiquinone/menaquinone biosynthesis C-methylase UbiE
MSMHAPDSPMLGYLEALRAAAEPTRLRIMAICAVGEWTVSELTQVLGQSQPRVSRHLKVLAEAGLLERFREGTWVFYRLGDRDGRRAARLVEMAPDSAEFALDRRRLDEVRAERRRKAQAYFDRQALGWERVRALTVADDEVDLALLEWIGADAPSSLLDIGTGTAHVLRTLAPRIGYGLGIDLSFDMLAVARANLEAAGVVNCQVRHGDMYQLPVADGTFACAVLHQVLHFAEVPAAAIGEATRTLAPGGRLFVVDLAPHDDETLRQEFRHRRLGFADAEIQGWFEHAGLENGAVHHLPGKVAATVIWEARRPGAAVQSRLQGSAVA